ASPRGRAPGGHEAPERRQSSFRQQVSWGVSGPPPPAASGASVVPGAACSQYTCPPKQVPPARAQVGLLSQIPSGAQTLPSGQSMCSTQGAGAGTHTPLHTVGHTSPGRQSLSQAPRSQRWSRSQSLSAQQERGGDGGHSPGAATELPAMAAWQLVE